eukprot:scaffold118_cov185-Amphora_coffeaeformis.AAC.13
MLTSRYLYAYTQSNDKPGWQFQGLRTVLGGARAALSELPDDSCNMNQGLFCNRSGHFSPKGDRDQLDLVYTKFTWSLFVIVSHTLSIASV